MLNLEHIITTAGYFGIFFIIFAESGLFFGFFLPGDSLLFTAGFLASQGYFSITLLAALAFLGAVLGDNFGYFFGRKVGPRIFTRDDSFFFHKDHLRRAQKYYREHGSKTIMLARFIPIVRTFAPILAGVGEMPYDTFAFYNFIGGGLWGVGIPVLGYYLGSLVPDIDRYLVPTIIGIILVSLVPTLLPLLKRK